MLKYSSKIVPLLTLVEGSMDWPWAIRENPYVLSPSSYPQKVQITTSTSKYSEKNYNNYSNTPSITERIKSEPNLLEHM